ncbi:3-methyladenine DNA glycosylase [Bowdeniella nasicola]|uniref:3-methyladenine DNA glycosylase n=1 Tax=Bowdeniella nasicola TaxID=208480 RepID=A0A1Q5Q3X8_9ACTO|nr:3-methyladenine DNA glycosylase [Bowdeniella nasicola]OKL54409.1 3-methyladenine DNA glycosylase [Bowdeniella nasicola]
MCSIPEAEWRERQARHEARVDELTADHLARRSRGEKHPVMDFLFEYYGFTPGKMRRWHPGPGIVLEGCTDRENWPLYCTDDSGAYLDIAAYRAKRGRFLSFVHRLLTTIDARPAQFSCFGLHEWAMVYRQEEHRHPLPLRLGKAGTDAVVEAHELRCTHADAFRFFTPDAEPRNASRPTYATQVADEQPGCIHAGSMDLYRWAFKLTPGINSDLLLTCFEHAITARQLDMMSAPYDTTSLGLPNIAIETPEGKAQHVAEQRSLESGARPLRAALVKSLEVLLCSDNERP